MNREVIRCDKCRRDYEIDHDELASLWCPKCSQAQVVTRRMEEKIVKDFTAWQSRFLKRTRQWNHRKPEKP